MGSALIVLACAAVIAALAWRLYRPLTERALTEEDEGEIARMMGE